jgi:hypothetical protein
MKKLVLLFTLIITMFTAQARKFYVSESGNDTYSTSQAQSQSTPWKTLSKVQSNVANGDSVLFAKGSKFTGTLTLNSKSNVYFGVYGTGADPLFWGTGATIGSLVILRGCTNVTFYGWNISDTTISFTDRYVQAKIQIVFTIESSSTGTVIRKCTMDRIGYGVYITASSRAQTIDSCSIGNLRMIVNDTTNPDNDYGGVPVQFSSRNNTFINNYLHDCWSISYDYGRDGGGVEFFEEGDTVMNNVIMYNTFYDCNGTFEFGSNSDGVANNPQMNNVIAYNKIINNTTVVYINNNGQYKTKVTNLQFYNNVMIQTVANPNPVGSSGIMFSMATADATVGIIILKNNIIKVTNGLALTRSGQFSSTNLIHTNNIYKLSGGTITNFTLDPTETGTNGNTWMDTTNTNPLYWDYNLLSTSYAISNGVNVGLVRDFAGNAVNGTPSIGVYQYNGLKPVLCEFKYGQWSICTNGIQTRLYTSFPASCLGSPPTDSIQRSCVTPVVISRFNYNSSNRRIYITCNVTGVMVISNISGNIRRTYSYRANGDSISVSGLSRGTYYASTQGQSIMFMR